MQQASGGGGGGASGGGFWHRPLTHSCPLVAQSVIDGAYVHFAVPDDESQVPGLA